ncbi:MAG: HAD family hydrolase [Planctomycetota bacterium]
MRAVFLDRDGTINEDAPGKYVLAFEDFRLIDGAVDAIARLSKVGFLVFVVTNQATIGRGWTDLATFERIKEHLTTRVEAAGGKLAKVYFCPHRPEDGCACRKPGTGMIDQALDEHPGIDVGESFLVGDTATDMELAGRAGLRAIFVLTGHGARERTTLEEKGIRPEAVTAGLAEAADHILGAGRGARDTPRACGGGQA